MEQIKTRQSILSKDFRVTEIFGPVFQGESKYTGVPSVFLRLFGCNFQCGGFGMKQGELSNERNQINPDDYDRLEDLPLVSTGCDSYPAWDVRFKKFSKWYSVDELATALTANLPNGWGDTHLVITGGEPLLGWQSRYKDLLSHPKMVDLRYITFETNTTQVLSKDLALYLGTRFDERKVFFSMSAKLPHSGHGFDETIKPEVVDSFRYFDRAFKFVAKEPGDMDVIASMLQQYGKTAEGIPVYVMSLGGTLEEHNKYKTEVANAALERGWRYSDRLHVQLYGNTWAV